MIVGHSRITNRPSSLASIRGYLKAKGENEEVILHYDEDEEGCFFETVKRLSQDYEDRGNMLKYSMRHFHISPSVSICADELDVMEAKIREVYQIDPALPVLIAEHHKHASDGSDRAAHYHFLFPEVQLGARRLMSETSSQFKNNLIARSLEVEFGHEILTSRHNHKIIEHLDVSSQEVASLIREAGSQVIKPQASRGSRDAMERLGINGSKLAAQVQKLARAHTISSERRDLILSAILHEHGLHLCHGTRGRGLHSVMLAAHGKEGRHQIIGSLRKVAQVPTSFTRHFNPENFTPNKIAERITHARHGHTHTTSEQHSQVSSHTTNAEPSAFRAASANQSVTTNFGRGLGSRLSAGIPPELGAAISSNPSSAGFSLTVHPNMTREQKIKAVQDFMMNVSRDRQQALTLQPKL